jgi:hypothetical protein
MGISAGHDKNWRIRVSNNLLGYASKQHAVESSSTMSRDHDKIDIRLARFAANLTNGRAGSHVDRALHVSQKIEFAQ